jgi:hypothetical protein
VRNPIVTGEFWRRVALALALAAVVIVSSMVLVRYRNRDRTLTNAVSWAFDSLRDAPADVVSQICPVPDFTRAVDAFERRAREGTLPVDSVRIFYADFTLAARDGAWRPDEIARLARYLGVVPKPARSAVPAVDSN